MNVYAKVFKALNSPKKDERLEALETLMELENSGAVPKPEKEGFVNNHIHTIYSFSPYSPSKALWLARSAGLDTAGIMDHDSVGGCREFVKAGQIVGMAVTCGFECRVSMASTPFEGRRLNNPDQDSVAYVVLHGIPHQNFGLCEAFLAPYRNRRSIRSRAMTEKLNEAAAPLGIALDFDRDVVPLSQAGDGGTITERHILFALSLKMVKAFGKGPAIADQLKTKLGMELSPKAEAYLDDRQNPFYEYDLLSAMKSGLVSSFYLDATGECPPVREFLSFAEKCGGISAYAYLGDVDESPTGDKKAQKYEDGFLEPLFEYLKDSGFHGITYMPSRNTPAQLSRVMALCRKHGLFEISGEDINSPRQSFVCAALNRPEFSHLANSTWALIGHERQASKDPEDAMFSPKSMAAFPTLAQRIEYFEAKAKS